MSEKMLLQSRHTTEMASRVQEQITNRSHMHVQSPYTYTHTITTVRRMNIGQYAVRGPCVALAILVCCFFL